MQLLSVVLLLVAPILALAEPVPNQLMSLNPRSLTLEKRTTSCKVNTDKVNMRKCPATCCASYGQFAINTSINVDCWENGEMINGYEGWFRITQNNDHYWVSNYYIDQSCWSSVYRC